MIFTNKLLETRLVFKIIYTRCHGLNHGPHMHIWIDEPECYADKFMALIESLFNVKIKVLTQVLAVLSFGNVRNLSLKLTKHVCYKVSFNSVNFLVWNLWFCPLCQAIIQKNRLLKPEAPVSETEEVWNGTFCARHFFRFPVWYLVYKLDSKSLFRRKRNCHLKIFFFQWTIH